MPDRYISFQTFDVFSKHAFPENTQVSVIYVHRKNLRLLNEGVVQRTLG